MAWMTAVPRLGRRIATRRDLCAAHFREYVGRMCRDRGRTLARRGSRYSPICAPPRVAWRTRATRPLAVLGSIWARRRRIRFAPVEAQALIDDAASLLLLQESLRGPAAQAYLVLLQQIAMSPPKLFTAYGSFFRAQIATDAPSFADHVLDQVISGRENPLAAACAIGRALSPPSRRARRPRAPPAPLRQRVTMLQWCGDLPKPPRRPARNPHHGSPPRRPSPPPTRVPIDLRTSPLLSLPPTKSRSGLPRRRDPSSKPPRLPKPSPRFANAFSKAGPGPRLSPR